MRPHTADEAGAVIDLVEAVAGALPRALSAGAWCTPPTSTTSSPAGPSRQPSAYDGFPQHENGIGMARAFEAAFHGDADAALGVQPGLLLLGRRRPGRRLPRPRARAAPAPDRPDLCPPHRARRAPVAVLTGEYGAAVLGPLARPTGRTARPRSCPGAQRLLRRQHRRHRPPDRGRRGPRPARPSPPGSATCCPTCVCPRGASSTA